MPSSTLRDQLLDAEQARSPVVIRLPGHTVGGVVRDVGLDYVTIDTGGSTIDCALFHVLAVEHVAAALTG